MEERGEAHGGMTANIPTLNSHSGTFFEAAYSKLRLHSPSSPHSCAGTEGFLECGDQQCCLEKSMSGNEGPHASQHL